MKFLFFSHDGKLGDAIIHTSLVNGIKLLAPKGTKIDCTARGSTLEFWGNDSRINQVFDLTKPSWLKIIKLGLTLRKNCYDHLICWNKQKSEKLKLLIWIANPKNIVLPKLDQNQHIVGREQRIVSDLFAIDYQEDYSISPEPICSDENYILLNLFAAGLEKTIDHATAIKLISGLRYEFNNIPIILICEKDNSSIIHKILSELNDAQVAIDICESISHLITICAKSSLIISPDTSLIHIGSALNKPMIGIYPDDEKTYKLWGPRGSKKAIMLSNNKEKIEGFNIEDCLNVAKKLISHND